MRKTITSYAILEDLTTIEATGEAVRIYRIYRYMPKYRKTLREFGLSFLSVEQRFLLGQQGFLTGPLTCPEKEWKGLNPDVRIALVLTPNMPSTERR
jgi:hypothetical protein